MPHIALQISGHPDTELTRRAELALAVQVAKVSVVLLRGELDLLGRADDEQGPDVERHRVHPNMAGSLVR